MLCLWDLVMRDVLMTGWLGGLNCILLCDSLYILGDVGIHHPSITLAEHRILRAMCALDQTCEDGIIQPTGRVEIHLRATYLTLSQPIRDILLRALTSKTFRKVGMLKGASNEFLQIMLGCEAAGFVIVCLFHIVYYCINFWKQRYI